jgi:cysteinyl-tRNA synthetase
MSEKTLGLPFDIHGGGRDLIFPHHENEIAQSCCSTADADKPESYAKYWMHNGFVTIDGEKMSKSLGNIILVNDLTEKYHGEVIRLALLSSHYRQGLDWNESVIHQAKKLLDKLYSLYDELKDIKIDEEEQNFKGIEIIFDDLNTPGLISEANKLIKEGDSSNNSEKALIKPKLLMIAKVLGIFEDKSYNEVSDELNKEIEILIKERSTAKENKNFDLADEIRTKLENLGIEIKDTPDGTSWQVK